MHLRSNLSFYRIEIPTTNGMSMVLRARIDKGHCIGAYVVRDKERLAPIAPVVNNIQISQLSQVKSLSVRPWRFLTLCCCRMLSLL